MKQFLYLVAVLLIASAMVSAEGVSPVFYGGAGIGTLVKPSGFVPFIDLGIGDVYKSGANFGGGLGFQLSPMFEIVGRFSYNTFSFDDEGLAEKAVEAMEELVNIGTYTATVSGDKLQITEMIADVKLLIPVGGESGTFRPFLLTGLGFANIKIEAWNMLVTNDLLGIVMTGGFFEISETKFLFNIGGGFDWMASPKVGIFADVRYAQVAMVGDPIGYVPVRAGLMFKFK